MSKPTNSAVPASRRGFLFGLSAGAGIAGAALVATPAKAVNVAVGSGVASEVKPGGLSDHAKKYYRTTTI
jgi:hypothetical protein